VAPTVGFAHCPWGPVEGLYFTEKYAGGDTIGFGRSTGRLSVSSCGRHVSRTCRRGGLIVTVIRSPLGVGPDEFPAGGGVPSGWSDHPHTNN
jgi:hypothetical protein